MMMMRQTLVLRGRSGEKRALNALRLILALVFSAVGCGFLVVPGIGEELASAGFGPGFRMILGSAHLVGGLALLVPGLAWRAALALGLVVAGSAFCFEASGVEIVVEVPVLLVLVLIVLATCLWLRRRVDTKVWREMIRSYADQQDSVRIENA